MAGVVRKSNGGAGVRGGSGRLAARQRYARAPMSEINVTPMVDVMLVLLIIFMVAAPLLTVGVPVQLPKTQADPLPFDPEEPLTISVDQTGAVFIQDTEISLEELLPKLRAIAAERENDRIYLKADKGVDYGKVMAVMGRLSSGGFTKIGLVTEQEDPGGAPAGPSE